MGWTDEHAIREFDGEHHYLSNFFEAPLRWNNNVYPSSEHLYQAMKATNTADHEKVRNTPTPAAAKKMGKCIPVRADWDDVKQEIMRWVVQLKFEQHPNLREKLLSTHPHPLFEGNWWGDIYWGVNQLGEGLNHLGQILMELRDELGEQQHERCSEMVQ